jgi:hypothetical protein
VPAGVHCTQETKRIWLTVKLTLTLGKTLKQALQQDLFVAALVTFGDIW